MQISFISDWRRNLEIYFIYLILPKITWHQSSYYFFFLFFDFLKVLPTRIFLILVIHKWCIAISSIFPLGEMLNVSIFWYYLTTQFHWKSRNCVCSYFGTKTHFFLNFWHELFRKLSRWHILFFKIVKNTWRAAWNAKTKQSSKFCRSWYSNTN